MQPLPQPTERGSLPARLTIALFFTSRPQKTLTNLKHGVPLFVRWGQTAERKSPSRDRSQADRTHCESLHWSMRTRFTAKAQIQFTEVCRSSLLCARLLPGPRYFSRLLPLCLLVSVLAHYGMAVDWV